MNLTQNPTLQQCADLLRSGDVSKYSIIVVKNNGDVLIMYVPDEGGAPWQKDPEVRFFSEIYCPNTGYIGPKAANDAKHVQENLDWLLDHWKNGSEGYQDF